MQILMWRQGQIDVNTDVDADVVVDSCVRFYSMLVYMRSALVCCLIVRFPRATANPRILEGPSQDHLGSLRGKTLKFSYPIEYIDTALNMCVAHISSLRPDGFGLQHL